MKSLAAMGLMLLLFVPVGLYLSIRHEPRVTRSLSLDSVEQEARPITLLGLGAGQPTAVEIPIWRVGDADFSGATAIEFIAATYGESLTLDEATLYIGSCVFRTAAASQITDGAPIRLVRAAMCTDSSSSTARLSLRAWGEGPLAVWTWEMPRDGTVDHAGLTLTSPESVTTHNSILRGRIERPLAGRMPRRISVVNWWWSGSVISPLLVIAIAFGAGLAGAWLLSRAFPGPGVGLVALSLTLMWAVLMPPLQGADEPDHLLSVAELAGRPAVTAALPVYARQVHFERIRFHSTERFVLPDTTTPHPVAWTGDIHSERMDARSPFAAVMWRIVGGTVNDGNPAALLFALRLSNAVMFSILAGLAAMVLSRTHLMLGVALMPTLPYFATMLSDWAYVAHWSMVIGIALIVLSRGGPAGTWAGVGLGIGWALLWCTSMAALPLLPLLAVVVMARLVTPDTNDGRERRWIFWAGLGAGLVLAAIGMHDLLETGYQRYDAAGDTPFSALLNTVNRTFRVLADYPWLAALVALGGWVLDRVCAPVRQWGVGNQTAALTVRRSVLAIAAAIAGVAAWSLIGPLPQLALMTSGPIALADYVRGAMVTLVTSVRLAGFDHLTFVSLWGGFGWLDALLPAPALGVVTLLLLASIGSMAHAAFHGRDLRGLSWMVVIGAGALLSAVAYATAAGLMQRNLHGRYLLPLAVPITIVAGSWLGSMVARRAAGVRWTMAAIVILLHGISLWWVTARYV